MNKCVGGGELLIFIIASPKKRIINRKERLFIVAFDWYV